MYIFALILLLLIFCSCLKSLLDCRTNLTYNDQLVMKAIPEAVLNYKEFSTRKEPVAEQLISLIANLYQEATKINEFVDILTAGFTGDESLITNTILTFRAVLQHQGQHLTIATLEFVLQQVSVFLVQKSRNQAEAAVAFLITFIKVMPIPLVSNYLETIVSIFQSHYHIFSCGSRSFTNNIIYISFFRCAHCRL